MISNLSTAPVTFKSTQITNKKPTSVDEIPSLDSRYTTNEQKHKTVTILGSSKGTDQIANAMGKASQAADELIKKGYNVLTGCGNSGIMRAAYNAAHEAETNPFNKKAGENLAIVVSPLWGDENLEDCRIIGIADSEAERIKKFEKTSDNFIVFPGSAATLQEAATLITDKVYPKGDDTPKNIFLVGKEYFKGLKEQYDRIYEAGLLKVKPENLFKVVDSTEEILQNFPEVE